MKNYEIAIDSVILLGNIPLVKRSTLMISMGGPMRGFFPSSLPCLTVVGISNEKHVVRNQKAFDRSTKRRLPPFNTVWYSHHHESIMMDPSLMWPTLHLHLKWLPRMKFIWMNTQVYLRGCVWVEVRADTVMIHAYMHTCIHACTHARIQAYMDT